MARMWEFVVDLNWSARIGLFIVLFFAFLAAFAPWVAPHGESEIVGDVWEPIGGEFLFGTDFLSSYTPFLQAFIQGQRKRSL